LEKTLSSEIGFRSVRKTYVNVSQSTTRIVCPKCGTVNENVSTCTKCGENLPHIDVDYFKKMAEGRASIGSSGGSVRVERRNVSTKQVVFNGRRGAGTTTIEISCPKCGKMNRNKEFCTKCGEKLPDANEILAEMEPMRRQAEMMLAGKNQVPLDALQEGQTVESSPRMIDQIKMTQMMEAAGFKNVQLSGEFKGFQFQIVAEGRYGVTNLPVLVRLVNKLDESNATEIANEYAALRKHPFISLKSPAFLYVVVAGELDGASQEIYAFRIAGGWDKMQLSDHNASALLIADSVSREVYPQRSSDKSVAKMREIIEGLLN
jgi:hypothetical protein